MTFGTRPRQSDRRILLIAYHFPPSAAVGGLRLANFARRLASFGWTPEVLTLQEKDVAQIDRSRQRELEQIPVYHAPVLPTLDDACSGFLRLVRRSMRGRPVPSTGSTSKQQSARGEQTIARLKRYVLSFLTLPDRERGWVLGAATAAIIRVRRHRIGWIMTSCPPYSVHLIGLLVKRLTAARWIADFRDPWMTTGSKRLFPTSELSLKVERWLERRVIEGADLVVFNVERLRDAYRDRYRTVPADKLVFVPNAVSCPRAQAREQVAKYDCFTLMYTGSLYLGRSPEPIFKALARLVNDGRIELARLRVVLAGQCERIDGVPTVEVARRYGLATVVEVLESVPYEAALEMVARSHLALLFAPGLPFQIPAKVYDYLATGTRILAIADDGGTADIVRDTRSGRTFSTNDVDGIARFIECEYRRDGSFEPERTSALARFDIAAVTAELIAHMDRVGLSASVPA